PPLLRRSITRFSLLFFRIERNDFLMNLFIPRFRLKECSCITAVLFSFLNFKLRTIFLRSFRLVLSRFSFSPAFFVVSRIGTKDLMRRSEEHTSDLQSRD